MKHLIIRVQGRVQGVFFRANTQEKAQELQIAGFVRNEPDGSVYVEAEGDPDALETFVEWLHEGPPAAKVEKVTVETAEKADFEGFRIEY